jgi:hypothetical protein
MSLLSGIQMHPKGAAGCLRTEGERFPSPEGVSQGGDRRTVLGGSPCGDPKHPLRGRA